MHQSSGDLAGVFGRFYELRGFVSEGHDWANQEIAPGKFKKTG